MKVAKLRIRMSEVPPSHRESLEGAELACLHIQQGTAGPTIHLGRFDDKLQAFCPECASQLESIRKEDVLAVRVITQTIQ